MSGVRGAEADKGAAAWTAGEPSSRRRLILEIGIVLGLSLGASAVYSILALVNRLTQEQALGDQTATMNPSLSDRPGFDLVYQLLAIGFNLVPVVLVFYLLSATGRSAFRRLGFDGTRPARDAGSAVLLALALGVPGLGLYFAGRALGITVSIDTVGLADYWWTIPVLILSALRAGLEEELIVVGYLMTRLRELGMGRWQTIATSALLRGTYHMYQGIGPFLGNVVMGVVFAWAFDRWGRTMPLVLAHLLMNTVTFVGYPLAVAWFPNLL